MKLLAGFSIIIVLMGFKFITATDMTPANSPESYCNPRFGYCFTYDAAIFNKIPEGINADGIQITDKSGLVTLESYGSFNPYHLDINTLLDQNLAYLLRNHPAKIRTINQHKTDQSYYILVESDDAFIKQELFLNGLYYNVLTVEVPRVKKNLVKHIMESTHFQHNDAMVVH